jgi:hypothetical protein
MAGEPTFSIPSHPTRQFPYSGAVEYEGGTVFELEPQAGFGTERLERLLAERLEDGPYRYGDFLNLPMVLYLVRDEETGDVFRVSVRDGAIRFHVLPETEPAGLRALFDRIDAATDTEWHVTCETADEN